MTERRYSEKDVAFIFERAASDQRSLVPGDSEGLTLNQLMSIGAEVGISPAAIEAAARALEGQAAGRPNAIIGTPVTPQYEVWVPHELGADDREDIVLAIRRRMGRHGIVEETRRGLEWRARDALGGRYITVEARDDKTLVRALGNFRDGAVTVFSVAGVGGLMAGVAGLAVLSALDQSVALGFGTALTLLALSYLPGRLFWKWRYRNEDTTLRATLADIVKRLEAGGGEQTDDELYQAQ